MICYVYVYCSDREKHELWARQYQKIRGVYIDRETLLKQLTIDVTLHSKALTAPITLFKRDELTKKETSMRNLSKECALFMWHQLLFETLLQSNQTSKARHEMLCECKQHYNNNKIELDKIIEFETNFSHDLAIRWYTRDCFLYRLLNKSMRTQNINEIYKYRSFILDLHEQLGILHQSMKSPEIMQVYRGQLMKFEELEQMRANINGLISLNTYFSTSTKAEVASNFCGGGLGRPTFQSVIFTINIKSNVTTKPFANIQEFSYMHDEGEVLFSAGTVFRINDVSEFNEGIWSTELELSSDVQEELDDVMQYMRMQIAERPTLATFGNFLAEMGDLEKAEHIGTVHFRAGDYQTALKMYKSALDFISSDDRGMSHFGILNNIATIHFNSGEYEMALEYYKQVINAVVFTDTSPTNATLVLIYQNVGLSYLATDNYDLAIDYFTHVLKLTNDATILAKTHSNVANALVSKKEFATALQNYELALKYYSSDSEGLVDTYNSIGLVHHYAGDFENAVLSFHQALAVQLATSPDDHAQLATIYNNLAKACCEVGDLDQAMIYFRKQLDLETDQDIRRQVEMNIRSVEQNL
ncbi:unnamed protein product [Rotaria sordida]|uniref:NAD(P)(+)--arginine ADP-ribosyltransferase n=2 Tax=Rotaria sordida TaxID=392033 RepID=A0A815K5U3_9BILA|nr:unnamed protein product [Rotaria sordida]